jgi:two-component system heavy metal sensor histidine kinase CusS
MSLKIKDRLALNYLVATSLLMAAIFSIIYFAVEEVVMFNIDRDLSFELNKHTEEVLISGDELRFVNMAEWEEREHLEVQVNPVFIQIVNVDGEIMGRSPNLKNNSLRFIGADNKEFYNQKIGNQRVRTAQISLEENNQISGVARIILNRATKTTRHFTDFIRSCGFGAFLLLENFSWQISQADKATQRKHGEY